MDPVHYHLLPEIEFDEIARGEGSSSTVARLRASESSCRKLLLKQLLVQAEERPELLGPLPLASAVWDAIADLEADPASAAVFASVMMHPQVGVWMSHTLRAITRGTATPLWPEVGQIHCVTFAAAVRSGRSMTTRLPARAAGVLLPTLGLARFPDLPGTDVVTAVTANGVTSLRAGGREIVLPSDFTQDGEQWWGLRRISVGTGERVLRLFLDDIDPFRDFADPVPPRRLPIAAVEQWRGLLEEAWRTLNACVPQTAAAMAVGVNSLVPLPESEDGSIRSASTGDGFGAVLLTRPSHAVSVAEMLVHEFQHAKLGALLHQFKDFIHDDGTRLFYAPWRDDPRPLAALFQGAYAFLGIAAFYRSRCESGSDPADQFEYAYARRQTWLALYYLAKSCPMSEHGERFVRGMKGRLQPWMAEPVSPAADRGSWMAVTDHRIGWRIRNCLPDPDRVRTLAEGWMARYPAAPVARSDAVAPAAWSRRRLTLLRTQAGDPQGFLELRAARTGDGDVDLLGGNAVAALEDYRNRLNRNVDDDDAWAGLALASVAGVRGLPWRTLLRGPELVKGVCQYLRWLDVQADPLAIAAWCEWHGESIKWRVGCPRSA